MLISSKWPSSIPKTHFYRSQAPKNILPSAVKETDNVRCRWVCFLLVQSTV